MSRHRSRLKPALFAWLAADPGLAALLPPDRLRDHDEAEGGLPLVLLAAWQAKTLLPGLEEHRIDIAVHAESLKAAGAIADRLIAAAEACPADLGAGMSLVDLRLLDSRTETTGASARIALTVRAVTETP